MLDSPSQGSSFHAGGWTLGQLWIRPLNTLADLTIPRRELSIYPEILPNLWSLWLCIAPGIREYTQSI